MILLPWPSTCWNYKHAPPPHPAGALFLLGKKKCFPEAPLGSSLLLIDQNWEEMLQGGWEDEEPTGRGTGY
jgi:hypothetical protein